MPPCRRGPCGCSCSWPSVSDWVLIAEIDARATELGDDDAAFVPALVARGFVLHRVGAKAIKISMEGWRYLHRHPPAPPDRASPPRRN